MNEKYTRVHTHTCAHFSFLDCSALNKSRDERGNLERKCCNGRCKKTRNRILTNRRRENNFPSLFSFGRIIEGRKEGKNVDRSFALRLVNLTWIWKKGEELGIESLRINFNPLLKLTSWKIVSIIVKWTGDLLVQKFNFSSILRLT